MILEGNLHKGRRDLEEQLNKLKGNLFVKLKNARNATVLKALYNNILN